MRLVKPSTPAWHMGNTEKKISKLQSQVSGTLFNFHATLSAKYYDHYYTHFVDEETVLLQGHSVCKGKNRE